MQRMALSVETVTDVANQCVRLTHMDATRLHAMDAHVPSKFAKVGQDKGWPVDRSVSGLARILSDYCESLSGKSNLRVPLHCTMSQLIALNAKDLLFCAEQV